MTAYPNVFISGASSGLGRGLSAWFVRQGSQVFAAARREEQLKALQEELKGAQGKVQPVVLDVSDTDRVVSTLQRLDEESGGIDLVIANAGVGGGSDARRIHWPELHRMLQVNVLGATATLTALAPAMAKRGRGHLVAISSLAAFVVPRGAWAYSASKQFIATVCEGLRRDLEGTGVKVTTVHPGFVKSEMTQHNTFRMPFLLETEDAVQRMGEAIARGDETFSYPWPLAAAARVPRWLPKGLDRAIFRRMKVF